MPVSTIFQLYCGGQVYWWRKPEYLEKTTDLSQKKVPLIFNKDKKANYDEAFQKKPTPLFTFKQGICK
jgi:hypothetical protein